MLGGKSVLVTGGSGSFGNAFARHVLDKHNVRRLIIFSRDEVKQAEMRARFNDDRLRFRLGDIRDINRLEMACRGVDIIIHAAAMKRVDACETDPVECIRTNVIGAQNVVEVAARCGVERLMALSTDKAAANCTMYGASKLCAERLFIAANTYDVKAAAVRYGNVAGSRGSIIPHWQSLIAAGAKTVPVTHEQMTRFWFRLDDAVAFTLWALEQMEGGELFVPRLPSFRVTDLAEAMGAGYEVTGIRGVEKLAEVLVPTEEARYFREWQDRYVWFQRGKQKGKELPDGFEYRSDTNPVMMSVEDLIASLSVL